MPVLPHVHQWTHTVGGLLCILSPCNAFMSPATLQANNSTTGGQGNNGNRHDGQDDYNKAWKKSGGG